MQENSVQSKTKLKCILIGILVLLFSLSMGVISVVQIVKINKLNDKIEQQERLLEDLNSQYDELIKG